MLREQIAASLEDTFSQHGFAEPSVSQLKTACTRPVGSGLAGGHVTREVVFTITNQNMNPTRDSDTSSGYMWMCCVDSVDSRPLLYLD